MCLTGCATFLPQQDLTIINQLSIFGCWVVLALHDFSPLLTMRISLKKRKENNLSFQIHRHSTGPIKILLEVIYLNPQYVQKNIHNCHLGTIESNLK